MDPEFFVQNPDSEISGLLTLKPLEAAPAPPPAPQRAIGASAQSNLPRMQCVHCAVVLEFRRGASFVHCPRCNAYTAVGVQHQPVQSIRMLCTACSTVNVAPHGARLVRCGSCATVSDISHIYR